MLLYSVCRKLSSEVDMFGVALFLLCALLALVALFAQGDPVPLTVTDRVKMWLDKLEADVSNLEEEPGTEDLQW